MNADRRKSIARIANELSGLRAELDELANDERESADAMAEHFEGTERHERAEECAGILENAVCDLESLESELDDIQN